MALHIADAKRLLAAGLNTMAEHAEDLMDLIERLNETFPPAAMEGRLLEWRRLDPRRQAESAEAIMKDRLLRLLANGATTAAQLAICANADRLEVIHALKALKAEGKIWRTDKSDGTVLWSLAGVSPGGFLPSTPAAKKSIRTRTPLRQPSERPARLVVEVEQPASWWVGLSREQLAAQAKDRADQMTGSRMGKFLTVKALT